MKRRIIWITAAIVLLLIGTYQLRTRLFTAQETFSDAVLTVGFKGQDVYELQGRLKYLGYYYGKVDGDFGNKTLGSVKWFQSEFGMKVDGVVGGKTKVKLWNATKDWVPSGNNQAAAPDEGDTSNDLPSHNNSGFTSNDLKIMANAVHGEARGEPYEGQVAVAAVILNRVKSANFPNTVSGVIFQPGAFTAVADGQIWLTPNDTSRKAVQDAINGWDPSGGCEYYFNPETATSKWIWTRPQVKTIGKHIFCK